VDLSFPVVTPLQLAPFALARFPELDTIESLVKYKQALQQQLDKLVDSPARPGEQATEYKQPQPNASINPQLQLLLSQYLNLSYQNQ
jgi:hypothetical protein